MPGPSPSSSAAAPDWLPGRRDRCSPDARSDPGPRRRGTRLLFVGRRAAPARGVSQIPRRPRPGVGIGGIPYKCPPAPVEFVFMLRGVPAQACSPRPQQRDPAFAAQSSLHDRVGEQGHPADPRSARDRADHVLQRRSGGPGRPHGDLARRGEGRVRPAGARPAASRSVGRDRLGPRGSRGLAPDGPFHVAGQGPGPHLRDGRRDRPADQQERFDRALRGPGRGQQDRIAGARERPEDQLRRPGHVLPRDR